MATCGLIPRNGWDGSAPVKGDGSFEWGGFVYGDDLPRDINPGQGWFTTSNQFNIPEDYQSNGMTYSTDWASDARHEVLAEWLKEDTAVGLSKSIQMQSNVKNVHAVRLLAKLSRINRIAIQTFGVNSSFGMGKNCRFKDSTDLPSLGNQTFPALAGGSRAFGVRAGCQRILRHESDFSGKRRQWRIFVRIPNVSQL